MVGPLGPPAYHTHLHRSFETGQDAAVPQCLLRSDWQGRQIDLGTSVVLFASCGPFGGPFRAVGHEVLAGRTTTVFVQLPHSDAIIWLDPSVPYPVAAVERFTSDADTLWVLDRFSGGDPATPRTMTGAPEDGPSPTWHPREPTGPEDRDLPLPFPLSDAFHLALEDPDQAELRGLVESHPESYVEIARFDAESTHESHQQTWHFVVTDGNARISVDVRRISAPPPASAGLPMAPVTDKLVQYRVARGTLADHGITSMPVPPAALPESLPSFGWIAQTWARATGTFDVLESTPHWAFRIRCATSPCDRMALELAGAPGSVNWRDADDPFDGETPSSFGVRLDQHGRLLAAWGWSADSEPAVEKWRPLGGPILARAPEWGVPEGFARAQGAPSDWWAAIAAASGLFALAGAIAWIAWEGLRTFTAAQFYTRIRPGQVLAHPLRAQIHAALREEPGLHFRALVRRLGMRSGTLRHHLGHLQRAGLVVRVDWGGYTSFFEGGADRRLMRAAGALKAPGARRLLERCLGAPGSPASAIARAATLDPGTATYHLRRLEAAGLVTLERHGRSLSIVPTPLARQALGPTHPF